VRQRPLTEHDAAGVSALAAELGYGAPAEAVASRLRSAAADPRQLALAAVDGEDRVVGWLHAAQLDHLQSPPCVEITGLVVAAGARRAGTGSALLAAAAAWAHARGVTGLRVRSNVVRGDTHAFYRRRGWREVKRQVVLEREAVG
jgi:GNAT superfamily N-acetyltransferase